LKFNKKGVSGAISAMFIIAIFFICLVSTFVIQGLTNSYNQTVLDRNRMDWERDSESIFFLAAKVNAGILNLNFSNNGGVTLHLIQVWLSQFPDSSYSQCTNQSQYWTSKYVSPGETAGKFGAAEGFKRVNIGSIGPPIKLSGLSGEYWKIKLVTERGNTFECQVPWPPEEDGGPWEGNTYAIIVADETNNFQYQDKKNSYHVWSSAWIKPKSTLSDHPLYRIKLRNTTPKGIVVHRDSFMHFQSTGSDVCRRIVSPSSDVDNAQPAPYVNNSLTIPATTTVYVYFAADLDTGDWKTDQDTGWFQVGVLIQFHFSDEPNILRTLTLPAQSAWLK